MNGWVGPDALRSPGSQPDTCQVIAKMERTEQSRVGARTCLRCAELGGQLGAGAEVHQDGLHGRGRRGCLVQVALVAHIHSRAQGWVCQRSQQSILRLASPPHQHPRGDCIQGVGGETVHQVASGTGRPVHRRIEDHVAGVCEGQDLAAALSIGAHYR